MMRVPTVFETPFRVWFFSGSVCAVLVMLPWVLQYVLPFNWQPYHSLYWWHQHEMVYAFAVPFILGFLLTASQNWTGEAPVNAYQLMLIVGLWWTARFAFLLPTPPIILLVLDVTPLLAAAALLVSLLIRHKNHRNLVMVLLLLLLAGSNALQILNPMAVTQGARFSMLLVIFFIVLFAGRVVPFFTAKGLGLPKVEPIAPIEFSLMAMQALATIILPFFETNIALKGLAFIVGCLHLARWARWQNTKILQKTLIWGLHLAYLFIVLGWFLVAIRGLDSLALHSLAVGGIGTMVLAFSGRVSLAHGGRPLIPSPLLAVALVLIALAVVLRAWLPALFNVHSVSLQYIGAGTFWIIGFGLFTGLYTRIWFRPRQDGRPG